MWKGRAVVGQSILIGHRINAPCFGHIVRAGWNGATALFLQYASSGAQRITSSDCSFRHEQYSHRVAARMLITVTSIAAVMVRSAAQETEGADSPRPTACPSRAQNKATAQCWLICLCDFSPFLFSHAQQYTRMKGKPEKHFGLFFPFKQALQGIVCHQAEA